MELSWGRRRGLATACGLLRDGSDRRFGFYLLGAVFGLCVLASFGLRAYAAHSSDCLPNVNLLDDHGRPFSPASLHGKVVLVSFVHTTCPDMCDLLVDKFAELARKLGPKLGSQVVLLSVSNDPETDKPAEMLEMARKHHADMRGWVFATGSKQAVEEFLRCYGLGIKRDADGEPEHIMQVFLVGPDGREVRQYWGVAEKTQKIVDDINRLLAHRRAKADNASARP